MARSLCRGCEGSMEGRPAASRYCSDECKDESKIENAKPRKRVKDLEDKRPKEKWLNRGLISTNTSACMITNGA